MTSSPAALSFPRLCALLGSHPSRLSQAMHNAAFKAAGLPFVYVACATENTRFGLEAMRSLGFRGLSLTIPHKEAAVLLVDSLSEDAKKIAAVNTVINSGTELSGHNTDWQGIVTALAEAGLVELSQKTVLVLGAGGAARAALYALSKLSAGKVYVANRTLARAVALAAEFLIEPVPYAAAQGLLERVDLIIQTTPLASAAHPVSSYPFDVRGLGSRHTVFDMVTKETPLLTAARTQGAQVIPGIRMLLHQATAQFALFTDQQADVRVMEEALLAEYARSTVA